MKYKLSLLLLMFTLVQQAFADDAPEKILRVQGQAVLFPASDELQLAVSVVSLGETAQQALQDNQRKMEKVLHSLQEAGIKSEEIQTQNFTINPTYTHPPKEPQENWRAEINGYEVRNSLLIKTPQLTQAGKIIDAAVAGGADQIDSLNFGLKNSQDFQNQALEMAVKNGMEQAQILAGAAGLQLKKIRELSVVSNPSPRPPQRFNLYKASAMMETHISPGAVEIQAEVSITFEIERASKS